MKPALDAARLRAERRARGLSKRDAAKAAGLSIGTMQRLEAGGNDGQVTLSMLRSLAAAVGLSPRELLVDPRDADTEPSDDARKLASCLAEIGGRLRRDDLSRMLGWSLHRLDDARHRAEPALEQIGIRLHVAPAGWELVHAGDGMTTRERERMLTVHAAQRGMSIRQAQLLRQACWGEMSSRASWSNNDLVAAGYLMNAGLADQPHNKLEPTEAVRVSMRALEKVEAASGRG